MSLAQVWRVVAQVSAVAQVTNIFSTKNAPLFTVKCSGTIEPRSHCYDDIHMVGVGCLYAIFFVLCVCVLLHT